ncbi:MAG: TAXI family TRAP transporter solute-binding subunit [Rhodospirillales bacterium]
MRSHHELRKTARRGIVAAAGLLAAIVILFGCTLIVPRPEVTIATGSPSGVYYPLGGSICRLFNLDSPREGRHCVVVPSPGPIANIGVLRDGSADVVIVQSDVLADAAAGAGVFASRGPAPDLRTLFTGHADAFTIVARRELGIRHASDLLGKRINMGSPGSSERIGMERIMAALGATHGHFAETFELTHAAQHTALCLNQLDAIVYEVAHPSGLIQDVVRRCRGVLVGLSGPAIDAMLLKHPEYERAVIPGGTYLGNPQDVQTIGARAVVVTTTALPDTLAYEIVKGVFDNLDDFRRLHPAFSGLSATDMVDASGGTPLHRGAARYYRERGWIR